MTDPYAVLGVSPDATQDEITRAYRRALRASHPDVRSGEWNSAADERLRQILAAYALLRDPRRRSDYDDAHGRTSTADTSERSRTTKVVHTSSAPVRVAVTRVGVPDDDPPLRVGPVRWHR